MEVVMTMTFTDIHGHYAWDVDDGISGKDEARKALLAAKAQDINTIIATPHFTSGFTSNELKGMIHDRIDELKALGSELGITIYEGCELMLNHNSDQAIEEGLYLPIEGTSYLLCEFNVLRSTDYFMDHFEDYLRSVIIAGYKPVVAHVERYFHEQIDLDCVQYLIDLGCVIQVNTTNVMGLASKVHHKNAVTLLDNNMVHCVATDTHRSSGLRSPNMKDCYNYMVKHGYPAAYATLLLNDNPQRLLRNESVVDPDFKRSLLARLFK